MNTVSLYNLESTLITYEKGAATVKITTPDHEEGFGLLIKNANSTTAATIKIKGGNSVLSLGDSVVTVSKASDALINLKNTGRYKNVSGEDAGTIVLEISGVTPTDISLFAFEL